MRHGKTGVYPSNPVLWHHIGFSRESQHLSNEITRGANHVKPRAQWFATRRLPVRSRSAPLIKSCLAMSYARLFLCLRSGVGLGATLGLPFARILPDLPRTGLREDRGLPGGLGWPLAPNSPAKLANTTKDQLQRQKHHWLVLKRLPVAGFEAPRDRTDPRHPCGIPCPGGHGHSGRSEHDDVCSGVFSPSFI